MPCARAVAIILILLLAFVLIDHARAAFSPVLSSGAFIFSGWRFGVSAFGTGGF